MSSSFLPIQAGRLNIFGTVQHSKLIPKIMLLDMNSFFASVEQQANPFLRNRPLGVVATMHPSSCLIAASKEAKRIGIRTGTNIRFAKQICPDLVLLQQDPEKYRTISAAFSRILCDYSDKVERYSIDECFVDFRGSKINPIVAGAEIKQRIKEEVGEWLTCNIGIGDNKFLAKLAAELKKPDGLSVVWREYLAEVYKGMKFSDLWGIARGWTNRLAALNINSPLQLLNYPVQNLISTYGKPGFYIWRRVNGLEEDFILNSPNNLTVMNIRLAGGRVQATNNFKEDEEVIYWGQDQIEFSDEPAPKSFGHSWVLNFRTTDKARLRPVILRLAEKAARRMRAQNFLSYGIYLSLACADGSGFHQHKKLKYFVSKGSELCDQAMLIWKKWRITSEVSRIAVGFTEIKTNYNQLSLFNNRDYGLTKIIDEINNKYGEFTVRSGLLTNSGNYAPDAIAFGK